MRKIDIVDKTKATNLSDANKCGSCLHFDKHPNPTKKGLCKNDGIKAYAVAPRQCYTPDVTHVAGDSESLVQLASIFQSQDGKGKKILKAMLEAMSKKRPHDIGTKVYFLAVGKDYASNYLSGYVLMYTSTGEIVVAGNPDRRSRGRMYLAYFNETTSLLSPDEWKTHLKYLSDKGRLVDPSEPLKKKPKVTVDYEPPTLDSAPASWHDKQDATIRKSSRSKAKKNGNETIQVL